MLEFYIFDFCPKSDNIPEFYVILLCPKNARMLHDNCSKSIFSEMWDGGRGHMPLSTPRRPIGAYAWTGQCGTI